MSTLPADSVRRLVGRRVKPVGLELVLYVRLEAAIDVDADGDLAPASAASVSPTVLA